MDKTISSGLTGISSGFRVIDKITGGWQTSDLIVIGARPHMGKTSFMLSMALNIARHGEAVAIFSLEEDASVLEKRLICIASDLPCEKILNNELSPEDKEKVTAGLNNIKRLPFYIDDIPSPSVEELSTRARHFVHEQGVKIILIDYLELIYPRMKFEPSWTLSSWIQERLSISDEIKRLAKELHVPIILFSQISKLGVCPISSYLSQLHAWGTIERDADVLCFICRRETFTCNGNVTQGKELKGKAEFVIAKGPNGSNDTIELLYKKEYARFENMDE